MQSTPLFVCVILLLSQAAARSPQLANIVETTINDGRFKTLVTALKAGSLVDTLEGLGPFTVFAPTDAAFAKLPPDVLAELLRPENKEELVKILTYHVVAGKTITAADIITMGPPFKLEMANTIATNITKAGARIKINNSTVIQADIMASNGIIHAIDTVLLPRDIVDTVASDGRFKTLITALTAGDFARALQTAGPLTLFAPTDDAFAKLPPGALDILLRPERRQELVQILAYHVVLNEAYTAADIIAMDPPFELEMFNTIVTNITKVGPRIKINNSTVIQANIEARNGIIHAIDRVLFPPDIVDTAASDRRFKTLVTLLTAAGLVDTLKSNGPFTVFAPTNAAFAKLPPGTIDDLLKPENKPKLITILTYHVIGGRALSSGDIAVMNPPFKLEMLNGLATTITGKGMNFKINDAKIIVFDIRTLNGIIHAIDTVLLPSE